MATQYNEVTEVKFYNVEDVMRITGLRKNRAYEIIAQINKLLEAKGKLTIKGKVNAAVFNMMF